jgi:hypothetical protein
MGTTIPAVVRLAVFLHTRARADADSISTIAALPEHSTATREFIYAPPNGVAIINKDHVSA